MFFGEAITPQPRGLIMQARNWLITLFLSLGSTSTEFGLSSQNQLVPVNFQSHIG